MNIHIIPIDNGSDADKCIVYRPLSGLAFVGNGAMAELATAVSQPSNTPHHNDAVTFLKTIGFMEPDPAPPPPIESVFRPTTAVLLMTNQCQLRCTYCYAAAGEEAKESLTEELGRTAIDYVCQTALELERPQFEVSFHGGGEPTFAWPVLQACIAYARQKPLPAKISLTSNGIWSPQRRAWLIENLDGLSLSVDGAPETQDRQRPFISGRGSAKMVMQTIADLDKRQFPYGIRMTATAPWRHFPEDVRFLCAETNCRSMQVEPAFNTGRGGHGAGDEAGHRAFAGAFLAAYEIAVQNGRQLHYAGARLGVITRTFCVAPYNALIVNPRGELVTCYEITGGDHALAGMSTIGRVENGRVIIDEQARRRLHSLMAERRVACRDCFCYWSCAGDCYTRSFQNQPDGHLVHGLRCQMNRTITREILLNHIAGSGGVWHRWPVSRKQVTQTAGVTI